MARVAIVLQCCDEPVRANEAAVRASSLLRSVECEGGDDVTVPVLYNSKALKVWLSAPSGPEDIAEASLFASLADALHVIEVRRPG